MRYSITFDYMLNHRNGIYSPNAWITLVDQEDSVEGRTSAFRIAAERAFKVPRLSKMMHRKPFTLISYNGRQKIYRAVILMRQEFTIKLLPNNPN